MKGLTIVRAGETTVTLMLIKIVQEGEIEYAAERRVYIAMNTIEDVKSLKTSKLTFYCSSCYKTCS